jgi:hypothetical protein
MADLLKLLNAGHEINKESAMVGLGWDWVSVDNTVHVSKQYVTIYVE